MKLKVGVIFGGESVEHEVSIISALQAMEHMNKDKYDISSNFKLADTNIGTTNGINTIPLYMAFLIK